MDMSETTWSKSTFCSSADCVEVGRSGDTVVVRNSRGADLGAVLEFSRDEWRAFIAGVKEAEFDKYFA